MPTIDPTTNLGKVRLRVGDFLDLPIFPDAVYIATLNDCDNNVLRASKLMAQYILATLTMRVHEKMAQLEVYGNQYVDNYVKFLKTTILNPNMMEVAPLPYGAELDATHPLLQFRDDWNKMYIGGTASEQTHLQAVRGMDPYGFF
jgi:hypothetical protein